MPDGPVGLRRWCWLAPYTGGGAALLVVVAAVVLGPLLGIPPGVLAFFGVVALVGAVGFGALLGGLLLREEPVPSLRSAAATGVLVAVLSHLAMALPLLLYGRAGLVLAAFVTFAALLVAGPVTLPAGAACGALAAHRRRRAAGPLRAGRQGAASWLSRGCCARVRRTPRAVTP